MENGLKNDYFINLNNLMSLLKCHYQLSNSGISVKTITDEQKRSEQLAELFFLTSLAASF